MSGTGGDFVVAIALAGGRLQPLIAPSDGGLEGRTALGCPLCSRQGWATHNERGSRWT